MVYAANCLMNDGSCKNFCHSVNASSPKVFLFSDQVDFSDRSQFTTSGNIKKFHKNDKYFYNKFSTVKF